MHIEFQISTEKLVPIIRNRIRKQIPCVPSVFSTDADPMVVDHIDLGTSMLRLLDAEDETINLVNGKTTTITAKKVQLQQTLTVHAVTINALETAGTEPASSFFSGGLTLFLDVRVRLAKGISSLCVDFHHVDLGVLESMLDNPKAVAGQIAQAVWTPYQPIDLSAIAERIGHEPEVLNLGLGMDTDTSRMAIRFEVDEIDPNASAAWSSFLNGSIEDRLGGRDWALLIDRRLMVPNVVASVEEMLADAKANDFDVLQDPTGAWTPAGGVPRFTVTFGGEALDACPYFVPVAGVPVYAGQKDVNVDVTVVIELSVPKTDELRTNAHLHWTIDDSEALECVIAATFMWPVVGNMRLGQGKITWGEWALGWVGSFASSGLVRFIAAIVGISGQEAPIKPTGNCVAVEETDDDLEIECVENVDLGAIPLAGALTLEAITGEPEGPVLSGTVATVEALGPQLAITSTWGLEWGIHGTCESTWIGVSGGITMSNKGQLPLKICAVSVPDPVPATAENEYDPLNQFSSSLHWIPPGSYPNDSVELNIPAKDVNTDYLDDPYPARVLIQSNGGARLITLAAFGGLSDEQKAKYQTDVVKIKFNCKNWVQWWNADVFKPKWWPDPPPERPHRDVWQIMFAGLDPAEEIVLRTAHGQELAHAVAGHAGLAQLTMVATSAIFGDTLNILRGQSPLTGGVTQLAADTGTALVRVKHLLFVFEGVVAVHGPIHQVEAGRFAGAPALFCVMPDRLLVFDVSTPSLPRLVHLESAPGLRGGLRWSRQFIAYGSRGFTVPRHAAVPMGDGTRRAVRTLSGNRERDILAAVTDGRRVYALTGPTIEVYDEELTRSHDVEIEPATSLSQRRNRLVTGGPRGLEVFDVAGSMPPRSVAARLLGSVRDLRPAPLPDAPGAVLAVDPNQWLVLDPARDLTERARYHHRPWPLGARRLGNLLAYPTADQTIELWRVHAATLPGTLPRPQPRTREGDGG